MLQAAPSRTLKNPAESVSHAYQMAELLLHRKKQTCLLRDVAGSGVTRVPIIEAEFQVLSYLKLPQNVERLHKFGVQIVHNDLRSNRV
jgi:hypothetical protein